MWQYNAVTSAPFLVWYHGTVMSFTTRHEINRWLKEWKNTCGIDGISVSITKECGRSILAPLTDVNVSHHLGDLSRQSKGHLYQITF